MHNIVFLYILWLNNFGDLNFDWLVHSVHHFSGYCLIPLDLWNKWPKKFIFDLNRQKDFAQPQESDRKNGNSPKKTFIDIF